MRTVHGTSVALGVEAERCYFVSVEVDLLNSLRDVPHLDS